MVDEQVQGYPEPVRAGGGVRSVRRALDIMSLLRADQPVLTLRDIIENTGLPRTTVIRLVDTLEDYGLLWSIDTNKFVVGPAVLRWSGLAAETWQLPLAVHRAMDELARTTLETATLFVRQGTRRVCIGQEQSRRALRQVTQVGRENPLWAGAPAKVLLVGLSDDVLREVAHESPYGDEHLTRLRSWRDETMKSGYAVSHGEREDGLSVVSVPVEGELGETVAALAVGGPKDRFSDVKIAEFLPALRLAASAIYKQPLLAFAEWPPTSTSARTRGDAEAAGQSRDEDSRGREPVRYEERIV